MNHIKALGLGAPPKAPQKAVALTYTTPARTVTHAFPTQRRGAHIAVAPKPRPSEHPDPAVRHRVGGLIGELSAGAVMVDHAARELSTYGLFRFEASRDLKQLKGLSDKLVSGMQNQFDFEDADATNALSSALGLVAEKFCQLTPAQMDAVLRHMDEMVRLNITYVPAPTPTSTNLR